MRPQMTLQEQLPLASMTRPLTHRWSQHCLVLAKTKAFPRTGLGGPALPPGGPQLPWCPSQVCSPLGAEKGTGMRPTCSGQSIPTLS